MLIEDLGNYLMAGLPNATFIGFTGTPVDKTAYGKGTFKTFGCEDDKGYLHKYSIAESIEDGTTLPLYYNLAPNDMLVPHELMEKEFFSLAETEGIADIEELNKILERAVNLKNFLKGRDRIPKVARHVADHYRGNVEGLGYKAFLVAVDREGCAFYAVVRNAYAEKVYVDKAFQRKTNELVQRHVGTNEIAESPGRYVKIDKSTIEAIKLRKQGEATKIINLVKSIEKTAEDQSDDPYLVAMAERARAVQESFEDRQISTAEAIEDLFKEIDRNEQRKKEQHEKGLDSLTYFVLCKLQDEGIGNAEAVSKKVRDAFSEFPNWRGSEKEFRELRKKTTFAIFAQEENLDRVTALVDRVFAILLKPGGS